MKKVKFFASYCDDAQINRNIISSWGKGSDTYKDLLITADPDYDYAVLLNRARTDREISKENVIGFSHEPRMTVGLSEDQISYISNRVSEYYISNNEGLPDNFVNGFTFVCPSEFGDSEFKKYSHSNKMSMILSMSNFMPGHTMRHELLKRILETEMDIHFYANGLNRIYSDERVKEFDWDIFSKPYEEYEFQLVLENIIDGHWATEKLTNCVIKETTPIYYGSTKSLELFYPKNSIVQLDDNIDSNMEKIRECYYNKEADTKVTGNAKKILYEENNLLEYLHKKFNP